jgi:hypothetical protein
MRACSSPRARVPVDFAPWSHVIEWIAPVFFFFLVTTHRLRSHPFRWHVGRGRGGVLQPHSGGSERDRQSTPFCSSFLLLCFRQRPLTSCPLALRQATPEWPLPHCICTAGLLAAATAAAAAPACHAHLCPSMRCILPLLLYCPCFYTAPHNIRKKGRCAER